MNYFEIRTHSYIESVYRLQRYRFISVSYTHLDVYKRQVQEFKNDEGADLTKDPMAMQRLKEAA